MGKKVEVVVDANGEKYVRINEIIFKGKRNVDWNKVKSYLNDNIGDMHVVTETCDCIYLGRDFPDEYTGSRNTYKLKGTNAKAKANAVQGISELIEIANHKRFRENTDKRHRRNAKYGWYRYDTKFELPVYNESGEIERYNRFRATLLARYADDKKMYLYDILDIKKETSNSFDS